MAPALGMGFLFSEMRRGVRHMDTAPGVCLDDRESISYVGISQADRL